MILWDDNDSLLTFWFCSTIIEEVFSMILGAETALQKGSNLVDEYLRQFKILCDSLATIKKPIDELDKIFQLARGLGPEYRDFKIAMLAKPLYPSFTQFVSALQGHEQLLLDEAKEKKQHINHDRAFFGQRGRGRGNGGRFNSRGRGGFPFASRTGHNDNKNQQFGNKNKWKDTKSSQQIKSQDPSEEEKVICQVCFKANHTTLDCWHRFDYSYQAEKIPQALAAINLNEENHDPAFYADSGATSHMANNTGSSGQDTSQRT
ncbi:hypothetical protein AB3S75_034695 [Citrus x aurantiifolia]